MKALRTFFAVDCSTHGPARCNRQGECVLCGEEAPVGLVAPTDGVWLDEHGRLHVEMDGRLTVYCAGQYPQPDPMWNPLDDGPCRVCEAPTGESCESACEGPRW